MLSLLDLLRRIDAGDATPQDAVARRPRGHRPRRRGDPRLRACRRSAPAPAPRGRSAASRSASRTSSTPPTCRPRWARRSTPAGARRPTRRSSRRSRRAGATPRQDRDDAASPISTRRRRATRAIPAIRRAAPRRARRPRSAAGMVPARARHPDRRLDDPPGLVLRLRRDQALVPAAADGRRQVLLLDPRHARPLRRDGAPTSPTPLPP